MNRKVTATSMRFLEVLAGGASAAELEALAREARAQGNDVTRAEVEEALAQALRIYGVLEHKAHRESDLVALYESAGDLASVRRLDDVLRSIVSRARRILGCDVAYLSLNDEERGETYVKALDGAVSSLGEGTRIPFGAGLGGLIAQQAAPYASPDYLADQRFRHTVEVDRTVRAEGLVSLLGVPLQFGSDVLGVLYAANRTQRPFAAREVTMMASLAAHATVAIRSARLLAELEEANEELRARTEMAERAADVHDQLLGIVLRDGEVPDVARELSAALDGPLAVLDATDRVVAGAVPGLGPGERPGGTFLDLAELARRTGRAAEDAGACAAPVAAGSDHLGTILMRPGRSLGDTDRRMLERGALVIALLQLFRRTVADADARVRRNALEDLLSGVEDDMAALRERALRLGADLETDNALVVTHVGADHGLAEQAVSFLASQRGGLAARRDGRFVLLLPGRSAAEAAHLVTAELTGALRCSVTSGGAGPVAGVEQIRGAYAEAHRCVDVLLALGREGDVATAHDLGVAGVLIGDRKDLRAFAHAALGPVLDYDQNRGSALVATLEAYFGSRGNLARTGAELHVHEKTVAQRLNRVARLLGEDWQSADRALELQLALRVHRMLRGSPARHWASSSDPA